MPQLEFSQELRDLYVKKCNQYGIEVPLDCVDLLLNVAVNELFAKKPTKNLVKQLAREALFDFAEQNENIPNSARAGNTTRMKANSSSQHGY